MGATEDFLEQMRKRRQQQLELIRNTFAAPQQPLSPMAPAQSQPSQVMGLLKNAAMGNLMSGLGGGGGGAATPLTGATFNAAGPITYSAAPGAAGAGGFAQGVGSALGSAGSAIGSGIEALGSLAGAGASAAGAGIGSALAWLAALI